MSAQSSGNCVKEMVDVLGSQPLFVRTVSVGVKQHWKKNHQSSGAVWQSRWTSWAPVPNSPYGLCERKATLNMNEESGLALRLRLSFKEFSRVRPRKCSQRQTGDWLLTPDVLKTLSSYQTEAERYVWSRLVAQNRRGFKNIFINNKLASGLWLFITA